MNKKSAFLVYLLFQIFKEKKMFAPVCLFVDGNDMGYDKPYMSLW